MRVAVIAQQSSAGGGSRFLRPLLRALVERFDDVEVTVFSNPGTSSLLDPFSPAAHPRLAFEALNPVFTEVQGQPDLPQRWMRLRIAAAWLRRRRPRQLLARAERELVRRIRDFDVVYLAWPYFLPPMEFRRPTVAVFHDFNYKHGFGSMNEFLTETLERDIPEWVAECDVCVVDTEFQKEELEKYYGQLVRHCRVIHLASFATHEPTEAEIEDFRAKYSVPRSYVVCASNTSPHKNLSRLLLAYRGVREAGGPPLVLIGGGTLELLRHPTSPDGEDEVSVVSDLRRGLAESGLRVGDDVLPLGFVPDSDADAAIAGATLCVCPSLYEGSFGPGLDAWALGTPVVMSSIRTFEDVRSFYDARAISFDPLDTDDMRAKLMGALSDPESLEENSRASRERMERYTWDDVAESYVSAFRSAIESHA